MLSGHPQNLQSPNPHLPQMIATINATNVSSHAHRINCLPSLNHHFNKPSFSKYRFIGIKFPTCNYPERLKWSLQCDVTNNDSKLAAIEEELEEEEGEKRRVYSEIIEEREVTCEVEVVSWRERRIKAHILVFADILSVWGVLTDYDRLAEFIPNLATCKRVPCPHPGRIWLEQRGLQRALYWKIEALVLLELQELSNSEGEREIHFSLVEGDFKKFEGKWCLKSDMRSEATTLSYEVTVVPKFKIPAIILEKVIRAELPLNLLAVARRAESDQFT